MNALFMRLLCLKMQYPCMKVVLILLCKNSSLVGFDTKIAVALGNITIVGGSLSNFVFNAPRRHAFFNRPLIDWDLILVRFLAFFCMF